MGTNHSAIRKHEDRGDIEIYWAREQKNIEGKIRQWTAREARRKRRTDRWNAISAIPVDSAGNPVEFLRVLAPVDDEGSEAVKDNGRLESMEFDSH